MVYGYLIHYNLGMTHFFPVIEIDICIESIFQPATS